MRQRAWASLASLAAAIAAGVAGQSAPTPWRFLAGLLLAIGLALAVSLLPWRTWFPPLAAMPHLFQRPGAGQRWCPGCGRPAPADAACPTCGTQSRRARRSARKGRRLQGKPGSVAPGKK